MRGRNVRAFGDLLVLEIAGSVAGAYAGKLFADHGAGVVKIEPPGGDPMRHEGEDWEGLGTLFAYLNTSKRSRVLDWSSEPGRTELWDWLSSADAVIESSAPDPLEPITLGYGGDQLIKTYISPFGLTGPYAGYRSNEFTDDAIGGHLYLNGEPDREPITRPGHHSEYQAGLQAFIGTMAALRARTHSGRGQTVEVSHFEGMASLHQHTTAMWTHAGFIPRREGNTQPGPWHPIGIYPCKNRYVLLAIGNSVREFLAAAGLSELQDDPNVGDPLVRGQNKRAFDAAILPWLMEHTAEEIVALGQGVFAPVGPVSTLPELLRDEHLAERRFWTQIGERRPLTYPRGPFRVSDHEPRLLPPPELGEFDGAPPLRNADRPTPSAAGEPLAGPLSGIRVLDLTRVWAGPLATRMLADLGADVIVVEAPWTRGPREVLAPAVRLNPTYPENEAGERPWNRTGHYNELARNKRAVALRLDVPRGVELFEGLVRCSDVVIENFSPRVMPQLGLGWEHLRARNPHLIYVAMPGFGTWGPRRDWVAYGPLIESAAGLSGLMGYSDSGPYRSGVSWPDPVSGLNAVAATLLALWDREADPRGRGRAVEVAMIEAMTTFIGEELLASQVRGTDAPRRGNRNPGRAPQGCYPCAGEDSWIAISVTSDGEWRSLCELAELDASLAGLDHPARLSQHDVLDEAIADWTRRQSSHALMRALQERGVVACCVSDARELVGDAHLAARDFWTAPEHADAGRHPLPGIAIRLSETPAAFRRAPPLLGEHNAEVLGELLQLSPEELAELEEAGVIAVRPPE